MTLTDRGRNFPPLVVNAKALKKGRCKGNDDTETEVGNAQADCAGERPQTAGMEERGQGGMTWAQMKCDPAETSRRQDVAVRLNKLWDKRKNADTATVKRIDRAIKTIKQEESYWLKDAAYFLYI